MTTPKYIHGIHDPGGEHLMATRPGWVVVTEAIGADPGERRGRDYSAWADRGFGVIVRLNHGYGSAGTIPTRDKYGDFARRVANFVAASRGCTRWIIGNEPNHEQERPEGVRITAFDYAECFQDCHRAVRALGSGHELIVAAIAPWNVQSGDWLDYFRAVCDGVKGQAGGIALHTYSHGHAVELVTSEARMGPPFADRRFEFRAYKDFLAYVPQSMTGLPVYITETNQDEPWLDRNNGWVQAAYLEIERWNRTPGTQKVHCLCLYRWPNYDQWGFTDKQGVQDGFRQAVQAGYGAPVPAQSPTQIPVQTQGGHKVHVPLVQGGPHPDPGGEPHPGPPQFGEGGVRDWDERLTARGVRIETPALEPGQRYLHVVKGRWLDEAASGGRHHIYVDVLDEQGGRMVGVPLRVMWPGGEATIVTESKPGELWAANFPMSSSRNEFSIAPLTEFGERVTGIGMGADLGSGFNPSIHTSTALVYQAVRHVAAQTPPPTPPTMPELMHPIWPGAPVSQVFGVNPERYARFGLDGHNGLDFAVPVGSPVKAVDAGRVLEVHDDPAGYGRYVKLLHAWGESLYAHLERAQPAVGAQVVRGQVIGLSGNTGNSTGPHLHLGIRINPYTRGRPFDGYSDPAPLLPAALNPEPPTPPTDVTRLILEAAREFGVRPALFASLVWAESSYRWWAESSAGAMGLAQIMPATWDEWSVKVGAQDAWNPRDNLRVGAAYLAWCIRTAGDPRRGVAAYAWGIGHVQGGGPWPAAVTEYANKVAHGADLLDAWGVFVGA